MPRLAALAVALLLSATQVAATVITVTTTADEFGTGPACSLREAIRAADRNVAVGGCPAGTTSDTIILPSGTYTLTIPGKGEDDGTTGDLDYFLSGEPLAIQGAGSTNTVIDGNGVDRVFDIVAYLPVTISGVTIRNGFIHSEDGGGIRHRGVSTDGLGQLLLSDCAIVSNTARNGGGIAIYGGSVTMSYCTVSGNVANSGGVLGNIAGGGIDLSFGSLDVVNSTVSNNTAGDGAGIFASYAVTIDRSTISGNLGTGSGGGLFLLGAASVVMNSTTSGNTAGTPLSCFGSSTLCPPSAGVYNSNSLTVSKATIVDTFYNNSGTPQPAYVRNSILAAGSSGPTLITDGGHNLFGGRCR